MSSGIQSLVIPTSNVDAAKALLNILAGEPHTDQPYYVGWNVNGLEIGLNPSGHSIGMTGPTNYWQVDDIAGTTDELVAAGATVVTPATEVGGGTTIAHLNDADGNVIGLIHRAG